MAFVEQQSNRVKLGQAKGKEEREVVVCQKKFENKIIAINMKNNNTRIIISIIKQKSKN